MLHLLAESTGFGDFDYQKTEQLYQMPFCKTGNISHLVSIYRDVTLALSSSPP
jgi:hypothetical protein